MEKVFSRLLLKEKYYGSAGHVSSQHRFASGQTAGEGRIRLMDAGDRSSSQVKDLSKGGKALSQE